MCERHRMTACTTDGFWTASHGRLGRHAQCMTKGSTQRCRCSNGDVMVPDCVILLNRPDEMVIEWCEGRAFDPTTGIIYHPKFNPAPPEIEKFLVRRVDDTPHVIQQRLEQYHETFTEVIELYKVSAACVCARAGDQDCSVWCACVRARALTQHITHHARKVQDRGWVVS
eukprot:1740666-Rhodomonas_salina.2